MTRLTALQTILRRAGVNPPAAVETSGSSDIAQANRILDQENERVQTQGWTFNRVKKADLFPNGDGVVTIPDTALVVRSSYSDRDSIYVAIGRTLYNVTPGENTPEFTENPSTDYHLLWKFECIPPPVQQYIVERAAVQFIELAAERLRIGGWRLQTARQHAREAEAEARRYEVWQSRPNVFDTPEARQFRGFRPKTMRGETGY